MTTIREDDFIQSVADALQYISYYHPVDYIEHLGRAWEREQSPAAKDAIAQILTNSRMCAEGRRPICQDTGLPTFYVKAPVGANTLALSSAIGDAIARATRTGKLRPNSVDSLTGRNTGDNRGPGTPTVHFEPWLSDDVEVRLIL